VETDVKSETTSINEWTRFVTSSILITKPTVLAGSVHQNHPNIHNSKSSKKPFYLSGAVEKRSSSSEFLRTPSCIKQRL